MTAATDATPRSRPRRVLREIRATDLAVYRAIAGVSTPEVDTGLRRLSGLADHSKLWFAIATVLAARPGPSRRAAVAGAAGIALASASVNIVAKQLMPRRRPDPVLAGVPLERQVRMPVSTSFPSGHAASAFAFASAVGDALPALTFPLHLVASLVAYSRVHTGVHYPADVVIGAAIGTTCGAVATYAVQRVPRLGAGTA